MKYLVASGSRSGSEFSIKLLDKLTGGSIYPIAKVHSARDSNGELSPSYAQLKQQGRAADFPVIHSVKTLKLEDPGVDDDAYEFMETFPEAIVIATYRPVEKIVNSHGNIKPWGMSPDRVVKNWMNNLEFYEHVEKRSRLLMIPLESPDLFNMHTAARLVGAKLNPSFATFLKQWPRVNDLEAQKKESKDTSAVSFIITREELVRDYPEILDGTRRYEELNHRCNSNVDQRSELDDVEK